MKSKLLQINVGLLASECFSEFMVVDFFTMGVGILAY